MGRRVERQSLQNAVSRDNLSRTAEQCKLPLRSLPSARQLSEQPWFHDHASTTRVQKEFLQPRRSDPSRGFVFGSKASAQPNEIALSLASHTAPRSQNDEVRCHRLFVQFPFRNVIIHPEKTSSGAACSSTSSARVSAGTKHHVPAFLGSRRTQFCHLCCQLSTAFIDVIFPARFAGPWLCHRASGRQGYKDSAQLHTTVSHTIVPIFFLVLGVFGGPTIS